MTTRALSVEESLRRLTAHETHIGRVAFDDGPGPIVLPVNYRIHAGSVVFRTHGGLLYKAAVDRAPVAFEVDEVNHLWQEGWSVMVRGHLMTEDDPDVCAHLDTTLRAWDEGVSKSLFVSVRSTAITGRELT